MKSFFLVGILVVVALASPSFGFVTKSPAVAFSQRTSKLHNFLGDREREGITRDNEPEEFFQTNTDKMSDEEKIPIAVAGLVGISLPFVLGLIALYSAK